MARRKHRRNRLPKGGASSADRWGDWEVASARFPTSESRAAWLVNQFLRDDLTQVSDDCRRDLLAFVEGATVPIIELGEDVADDQLPTTTAVRALHTTLRVCLHRLWDGGRWPVEHPPGYALQAISAGASGSQRRRVERTDYRGSFTALGVVAITDALQDHWSQLSQCPRCNIIFLKHGKQTFCSPTCAQAERWDRFKAHRRPRDYRAERDHAARKRHYAKVKLQRKNVR